MQATESPQAAARRLSTKLLDQGYRPEGLYAWKNERDETLFWRIRLKNPISKEKWIRPMYLNGMGFVLGEPKIDGKKPLYRARDLLKNATETIWIVEGEPKVEALSNLGVSTTTSGAADSAHSVDWSSLTGKSVIIWPDNDDAGARYANQVDRILSALGCIVRTVDIGKLNLPPKGDCIDWIKSNPLVTRDEIQKLPLIGVISGEAEPIQTVSEKFWDSPILFDNCETPLISSSLLPEIFGVFAAELAEATETPEALSVMTILGVLSSIFAKRFVVSPKEGWREHLNLYALVALPPANNKSLVLNKCIAPLIDWEKSEEKRLLPELMRAKSERKNQEKRIEALRGQAAKLKNDIDRGVLEREIIALEASLLEPKSLPRLFINDATPEALTSEVCEQSGRLAIFSDEGGIVEVISGLYTSGNSNVDILLKGIDGGDVRVKRQTKSYNLNPIITIVLTVQPVVIERMASKKAFFGNGMLERFLYVIPKSNLGYRTHDKAALSDWSIERYHEKVTGFLNLEHTEQSQVLELSQEAFKAWKAFQNKVEVELRQEGKLISCLGWGGKICGFTLRIAGVLHLAEFGSTNLTIQYDTMRAALTLATALIDHAIAAFGVMRADPVTKLAHYIFDWIIRQHKVSFTQSEITTALKNKSVDGDMRDKVLTQLIDRAIIGKPEKLLTKKPTTVYKVNPILFDNAFSQLPNLEGKREN